MNVANDAYYFNSVADFVQNVKEAPRIKGRRTSSEDSGSSWAGTSSLTEAWDMIETGDPRLLNKWGSMIEKIEMERKKVQITNSVVGHQVNVPLYLMGVPQHMVHKRNVILKDKIINVLMTIDVPGSMGVGRIEEISAKALASIVEMENAGYRVNIYQAIGGYSSSNCYSLGFIKLKSDREPMNIKKLVFPLTHPSMLRRLEFKFSESMGAMDVTSASYGQGGGLSESVLRPAFSLLCRGQYYFVNYASFDEKWYQADHVKTTVKQGWV